MGFLGNDLFQIWTYHSTNIIGQFVDTMYEDWTNVSMITVYTKKKAG